MRCLGSIEHLDATLASLAREEGALRLRLGQVLEVLGRGAVLELGFSSLGAYAVERCERSARWAEAARCLARRLEELPELRRATAMGRASWSMAELLARVATPDDEARWLERAESRTVRQVRAWVARALAGAREAGGNGTAATPAILIDERAATAGSAGGAAVENSAVEHAPVEHAAVEDAEALDSRSSDAAGELCTLTCTVNHEDAWLFEATRCLLEQLGERSMAAQGEALLAEAQGTLLAALPPGAIDVSGERDGGEAQRPWVEQLRRWRIRAEAACEKNILAHTSPRAESSADGLSEVALAATLGMAPLEHASGVVLDRLVRSLSSTLARHELEFSRLVLRFHRADGWRRLGYATEAQYARERLGLSRSSLVARRALALRLEKLPGVAAALGSAQIGVEAALQLVRVATPRTEAAWTERARQRTIKHLREEVAAALTAVRWAGDGDCPPPEDTEMVAFQALEQAVVSGRFAEGHAPPPSGVGGESAAPPGAERPLMEPTAEARRAWCTLLGSLASWLAGGLQMSATPPCLTASRACLSAGRVTLRLRMSRETCVWWRSLEAQARRWMPHGMSWLRFLCLSVWRAWHHSLGTSVAYGHIYVRDRFRCTSPVCNRRDVTPHHLRFRSAGGGDDDDNISSVCTWCHLCGIHGGTIRALGTAECITWEFGPPNAPCLIVHGRGRVAA